MARQYGCNRCGPRASQVYRESQANSYSWIQDYTRRSKENTSQCWNSPVGNRTGKDGTEKGQEKGKDRKRGQRTFTYGCHSPAYGPVHVIPLLNRCQIATGGQPWVFAGGQAAGDLPPNPAA